MTQKEQARLDRIAAAKERQQSDYRQDSGYQAIYSQESGS